MVPKSGDRFPACMKPNACARHSVDASAGVARLDRSCANKLHDPEKWRPVFGQDHARTNRMIPKSGDRFSDKIMREQTTARLCRKICRSVLQNRRSVLKNEMALVAVTLSSLSYRDTVLSSCRSSSVCRTNCIGRLGGLLRSSATGIQRTGETDRRHAPTCDCRPNNDQIV
jgi:hypothetical protein